MTAICLPKTFPKIMKGNINIYDLKIIFILQILQNSLCQFLELFRELRCKLKLNQKIYLSIYIKIKHRLCDSPHRFSLFIRLHYVILYKAK